MMRIVVEAVFQTWGEAVAAADELRAADYDVLIADDVVDVYSNAAFAEVYTTAAQRARTRSGRTFSGSLTRLTALLTIAGRSMTPTCRLSTIAGGPASAFRWRG